MLVFIVRTNAYNKIISNVHEAPGQMLFVFVILSLLSIFSGFLTSEIFIGIGSDFFWDSIFILPNNMYTTDIEFLCTFYKNIPVFFSLFGIFVVTVFYSLDYRFYLKFQFQSLNKIYNFISQKWYIDYLYNQYIGYNLLKASYNIFFKVIDKGIIEILGPTGITNTFYKLAFVIKKDHSGYLYSYFSLILISLLIMVSILNF